MSKITDIDRSLVAIFDIEGFSKSAPKEQAESVAKFVENLDGELENLGALKPDCFSTGDGAIVSIGRRCELNESSTKIFLDFIISFVLRTHQNGVILRTAVNYSEMEKVVEIEGKKWMHGSFIQIGDCINIAARVITFCEPCEVLINGSVFAWLRKFSLERNYSFHKNEPFVTKHGELLQTYSYAPTNDQTEWLYSPTSPTHKYKRYNSFPSIRVEIVKYFMGVGLDLELDKALAHAFESANNINNTRQMISSSNVMNVLMRLRYDPQDTVYVLSRNDRGANFWTQPQREAYLRFLRVNAENNGGKINQKRVMIYDLEHISPMTPVDEVLHEDLRDLHAPKSFYSSPSVLLEKYQNLHKLLFGATISKKHKFAIIPVPAPESISLTSIDLDNIGKTLEQFKNYNVSDGPMKGIITADDKFVSKLIDEFEALLDQPEIDIIR